MRFQPKTQFYYTLPDHVKAGVYTIEVETGRTDQRTQYVYSSWIDRKLPPYYRALALMECVKDVAEISLINQYLLENGRPFDDDIFKL